ncbi:O-succinylbenzoic acid--CoA ligase [Bacteroidales bacterium]|nr:O-succinylbenzoic acid--CoA ligase [Bacteroidales bacterium]
MNKKETSICIEGVIYDVAAIRSRHALHQLTPPLGGDVYAALFAFLVEWFDSSKTMVGYTSGSTGQAKEIALNKESMRESARQTCSFLDLKAGDKALLCLPLKYIAGKMMVARSLVAGLDLYCVDSSGHPLKHHDISFDFAAMIPLQVYNSLSNNIERKQLASIKNLIIGGASIDADLETAIKNFPNRVFSTYGMCETLSHIALRQLNGSKASANYTPFASVAISLSDDSCLIIDAPLLCNKVLKTNDIAIINADGSFRIVGRKDNIINTGGIKIQIEEVEALIGPLFKKAFAISYVPDKKFGQVLVLLAQEEVDRDLLKGLLPAYHFPKKIFLVDTIPTTENGKIDRVGLRKIALSESLKILF